MATKRRPSATRTDVVKHAVLVKRHAGHITTLAEIYSGRLVRTGGEHRDRLSHEYAENMPQVLVAMRRDLLSIGDEIREADKVLRARLEELGYHPNGLPISKI